MSSVDIKNGKLIYRGHDAKVKSAVRRINNMGGFPIMAPGPKKKGAFTDSYKIIKPTQNNLWRLEDYI